MIYLFDRAKKLQKIIPRKHIINATQTKVRNGIYQLAVEVPIFYETKQGAQYNYQKSVGKAEFAGHYDDKNRFQLYKIYSRNITANEQGEFLIFDGVHIFFDEAKAMGNLHDRRFRDSEAKAPADVAFNSIGWTIIDYDVTDRHDINFYRASVTDAWNDLISTYGVEFDYELQFDGRKIISKNIIMKKQIGKWTGQRFAYGTNVLTLTQEQDESEVYTAAVGRGRGEESGDGFGPRLEFGDIAWSKDGITKPVGQNYIELPSATAEYGFIENGVVKPRIAPEIVFEDIEDKKKLADATYYWLLENCLPKATWKTEVARIGNLKLGDTVGVLYKAAGIIKRARVEKIEYNLLDPELSKLTLGDFHHFENRQMKRINAQIKRVGRDSNDRITRIKNEWNAWIDNQFTAAMNQFEQNLIDQQAQIEADRLNMTNLIDTKTKEFDESLAAGMEEAERKRQENYNAMSEYVNTTVDMTRSDLESSIASSIAETERKAQLEYEEIEQRVTDTVDTTRTELENTINTKEIQAKQYAEQQAASFSSALREDLEEVTSGHKAMIDDLHDNVLSLNDFKSDANESLNDIVSNINEIDVFLGDISNITLDDRLTDINNNFEERIRNVDSNTYNMLRGTQLDESDFFTLRNGAILRTEEEDNYVRLPGDTVYSPYLRFEQNVTLENGKKYIIAFDYRTDSVKEMDGIYLERSDGTLFWLHNRNIDGPGVYNLNTDGNWSRTYLSIESNENVSGRLRVGTNFGAGDMTRGNIDLKFIYVTKSSNIEWVYHPRDSTQSIAEVTRRVTNLEDGRNELITRTEYDTEYDVITQTVRVIEENVGESFNKIQEIENYDVLLRGSEVLQSVDGFNQKVWLNDFSSIGANLIPQSSNAWEDGGLWIQGGGEAALLQNIRTKERIKILPSTTYTLSSNSTYISNIERVDIHQYLYTGGWINRHTIPQNGEISFTTWSTAETVRITLVARDGFSIPTSFIDHPDGRVKIKLEVGSIATPMLNAVSKLEQLASSVSIDVAEISDNYVTQSQFDVTADEINGLVSRIGDNETEIGQLTISYDEIFSTVATINDDLSTMGSVISQTDEAIQSKVWLADIHNPNIIPYSAVHLPEHYKNWTGWSTTLISTSHQEWLRVRTTNNVPHLGIISDTFKLVSNEIYTASWYAWFDVSTVDLSRDFDYSYIFHSIEPNMGLPTPKRTRVGSVNSWYIYKYEITFTAPYTDDKAKIMFGTRVPATYAADVSFRINRPKLELGDRATPYHNAFSNLTQRADEIMLAVQGVGERGYLSQSDISVHPDYVQIGSQRLDGSDVGSILRVSPTGIDAVAEAMRLSGDLYVDGDITTLAVNAVRGDIAYLKTNILTADSINATHIESESIGANQIRANSVLINKLFANSFAAGHITTTALEAVEGEFASLFAAQLRATTITAEHIGSKSITVDEIVIDDALVETIVARRVFTDDITSKIGNFIDLNAGNIVTAGLSANVITSDHIQVGTGLIDKMFATSARIDQLITKTHFVNEMHALTLNVVDLNASEIRSRLLTANTIEAEWLKSGTSLIDRVFATTAMFERMMAKSGFVTSLSAVTLDLRELTIWRPDGVAFVMNGMERFGHPVPVVRYIDDGVETDDKTYWTNSRGAKIVGIAYGDHAGRYYNLVVGMGLRWDSDYAVQYCNVQIRTVNSPSGVNIPVFNKEITARRDDGLQWHTLSVPLGRPTYGAMTFQIEIFRRGDNVYAPVEMRYGRSWISA